MEPIGIVIGSLFILGIAAFIFMRHGRGQDD